ncbi:restriction endonuclease [Candidatus Altiarchaeota archaeon]
MADQEIPEFDFGGVIKKFIEKMAFTIESMTPRTDGATDFLAKTKNPMGGRIASLIRASPSPKSISRDDVDDLYNSMIANNAVRAAFITVSSFSRDAEEFVKDKPISLISKYQLIDSIEKRGLSKDASFMDALDKYGLGEKHFQGVEQSFKFSRSMTEARKHFESRGLNKGLFGGRKSKEVPVKVTLRYAPVSVLKMVTKKYVGTESQDLRIVENRDFMFVNLSNLDLYYIKKRRRRNSVEMSLNRSDILGKIMALPKDPKKHLMDLLEHGDLPHEDLEGKDLSILENKKIIKIYEGKKGTSDIVEYVEMFLEGLLETVIMLIDELTSGITSMGEGTDRERQEKPITKRVSAQINMPHHEGGLYDVWKYLETDEGMPGNSEVDQISYSSKKVGTLLEKIMNGASSRQGIIFMPYYRAKFMDSETKKFTKYEILITPRFKGEARKPSSDEGQQSRKSVVKDSPKRVGLAGEFKLIK